MTLDSALQNSYAEHVLSGKCLPINYNTYISMQQTVAGENISVNVARAVSKLNTIFMTFDNKSLLTQGETQYIKDFNNFYHPMNGWPYNHDDELEYQIQIGSKMLPQKTLLHKVVRL